MNDYSALKEIVIANKLSDNGNLRQYIKDHINEFPYYKLSKICELANSNRNSTAAFYTDSEICDHMVSKLPSFPKSKKSIKVLEPSVGVGNFLPALVNRYKNSADIEIDVVDIDKEALLVLQELLVSLKLPQHIKINFIHDDFLTHDFNKKYDIIIGNPPYQKIRDKSVLKAYRTSVRNLKTSNVFAYFVAKTLTLGTFVSLVIPKSTFYTPELGDFRKLLEQYNVSNITDYGEHGFKGVKIETFSFLLSSKDQYDKENLVEVNSFINDAKDYKLQSYIFPENLPSWLIYRNSFFDSVLATLKLDVFNVVRDRQITKKHTKGEGKYRVLKSRNIGSCEIKNIPDYDCFVDDPNNFVISKYMNKKNVYVAPNLTYYPRASTLPQNSITDGSVALLLPKDGIDIAKSDLEYFGSKEFTEFYRIVKNLGTRSLNMDKTAVFFWGVKKD